MRNAALVFLGVASPLLLVSLLAGAARPFVLLAAAFPVALMALGAARGAGSGRRGPRYVPLLLAALLILLEAGFLVLLQLRGRVETAAWPLGFPLASWVLLIGLGLLPLILVPAAYALLFGRHGLTAEDLEKVRTIQRHARGGEE